MPRGCVWSMGGLVGDQIPHLAGPKKEVGRTDISCNDDNILGALM